MILQTDLRLDQKINQNGCYFMCILFLCVIHVKILLSAPIINRLYNVLQEVPGWNGKPCLRKNCYVEDNEKIFKHLGFKVKYTDRHESKDYICKKNEIEILCFRNKYDHNKLHFCVGNGNGIITYNPMGLNDEDYELISKRIFIIEE